MGGTPAPPFTDFFRRKGGYGFGGYPPFTDKIRKVVFEGLPNSSPLLRETLLKTPFQKVDFSETEKTTVVFAWDQQRKHLQLKTKKGEGCSFSYS